MKYNRGTEIILTKFKSLNVVIGTIDKHSPKTLYIRISGWGNPINYYEDNNYKSIIRNFDKKIRANLFRELKSEFNKMMTMVDLDMRDSGIVDNKSSFMSCEITLFQTNNYLLDSDEIIKEVNRIIKIVIDDVFENNKYFKFFKKKKTAKELLIKA
tara:strand:- start:4716 stop:5183 length:468 start_codon:yes stop_codon:yes gene_type:complete